MVYVINNRNTTNSGLSHKFKKLIICSRLSLGGCWCHQESKHFPSFLFQYERVDFHDWSCHLVVKWWPLQSDTVPLNQLKKKDQQGNNNGSLHLSLSLSWRKCLSRYPQGFFVPRLNPMIPSIWRRKRKRMCLPLSQRKRARDKRIKDGCSEGKNPCLPLCLFVETHMYHDGIRIYWDCELK